MKLRLKSLKVVNQAAIRDAVAYMLRYQLNKWWVPRQMQACMWELGAKVTEEQISEILEEIYFSSKDTKDVYDRRLVPCPRYKCKSYFTPTK